MESTEFWKQHYQQVFAAGTSYLDYSNEVVQLQCFAAAMDGTGGINGKRCLDLGAGTGLFSRTLCALGAGYVCAVDFIPQAVEQIRQNNPQIEAKLANADELTIDLFGSSFDLVFAIEVLQYLDFESSVSSLWSLLSPGGRLIGVVPNADNNIIANVTERFGDNHFRAVRTAALMKRLQSLPGLSVARFKGLSFGADQAVAAYNSTDWSVQLVDTQKFNRIAFVAVKNPVTNQ